MNGKTLIDAIMTADSQSLRYCYVALTKTSMLKMMSSNLLQTSEKWLKKEETDRYDLYLKGEVDKVTMPDDKLRMEILLVLAEKLKINMNYWNTTKGLTEFGEQVLKRTLVEYKKIDKKFEGTSFDELIQYQLARMFEVVDKKLEKASEEQKEKFLENVQSFIDQLPKDQQDKIREELGIEDFSKKVMNKVLATGGASVLFSSIVNTMGFSFYMGASSLLASSAGLFGITLPFAAYTTMSSVIAVLAAPLFVAGMIVASGFYLKSQKNKLDKMMVPLSLMQLLLGHLSKGDQIKPSYDPIQRAWTETYQTYISYTHLNHQFTTELTNVQINLTVQKEERRKLITEIALLQQEVNRSVTEIAEYLKYNEIQTTSTDPELIRALTELRKLKVEINQLSRKEVGATGFLAKMKESWVNTSQQISLQDRFKKRNNQSEIVAERIIARKLPVFEEEQVKINRNKEKIEKLESKVKEITEAINKLDKQSKQIKEKQQMNQNKMIQIEKKYFGIEKLPLRDVIE
ncbi:hypothetical protein [Halalkalibacter akibai]|uniref:Uncharacterized protein n=1 Tax=Halalkalibacter akibai (strain ATCC 43226 / DSM 21942 / CIP 109018 / JCM 9157 / 1139) TaxID=1236973 RepID=W4QRX0_HALA3|nr:hypothetical protein [Halalkalibacter akibai]GAE34069.1 hypothetical protein JCM9157_1102 [Halalkalibacter akibai JCM 9157]